MSVFSNYKTNLTQFKILSTHCNCLLPDKLDCISVIMSMKCNCLLLASELKFNDRWDTVNVCQHSCLKREADQHVQM